MKSPTLKSAARHRTLTAMILVVVGSSCTDSPNAMLTPSGNPAMSQVPSERPSDDELIDRLVRRLPEAKRSRARELLRTKNLLGASSADPEFARLANDLMAARRGRNVDVVGNGRVRSSANSKLIRVDVVLAPSTGPRMTLMRRQGDDGVPVLVLGADDVTPEELSAGLQAAAASVAKIGYNPSSASRVGVRPLRTAALARKKSNPASLAYIKANAVSTHLEGFGAVRSLRVATPAISK